MHEVRVSSDFLDLFITFIFLLSFLINLKSCYPSASPRLSSKSPVHFAKEMGSTDESFSNTGYEPKDVFLSETYVEFNQEYMTEQRFFEDMDHDDAAIGEMLFNAHREQGYHSQREGLSVGQSSSSVSDRTGRPVVETVAKSHDRTGQPVVETGQELNSEHAQIRTLLDRQREQILADCQAEIRTHEFQADYDRRRKEKLSETIESQQQELHRAQAEERHRRDQQLLHEQLLKQNWDLREAH